MAAHTTLILSHKEVRAVVDMNDAVPAIEAAFAAHARGGGDFRAMPAYSSHATGAAAGVKWVNSHPQNAERHRLPAVMGVYVLSDPETAVRLAIMDGTILTAARTGAAAAVASKLALDVGGRAASIEETCACDIVCTSTPARRPIVGPKMVKRGTRINATGADAPGKQELDANVLVDAKVVVDDRDQAAHSGEVNVPSHDGIYDPKKIHGTLGEVITGGISGRTGDDEITLFDSTGLAIQDVALARVVYAAARERGLGVESELVAT